jgi:hypothetical protein
MSFEFDPASVCEKFVITPRLSAAAKNGLSTLLESIHTDTEITDIRWAAYMLATVQHECASKWLPIEEFGKGKGRPYGTPVPVSDENGTSYLNTYYGRGFVQLTWRANYDRMGRALGMGNLLVLHPEHALEPQTAYRVMSLGMRTGIFTGKKLADFIHGAQCDYVNARRIINGIDRAELIAGYAKVWEQSLGVATQAAAARG